MTLPRKRAKKLRGPRQSRALAPSRGFTTLSPRIAAFVSRSSTSSALAPSGGFTTLSSAWWRSSSRPALASSAQSPAMVPSYWHTGREIVDYVQVGEARAEYGEQMIEDLSQQLQGGVGRGYSSRNLWHCRDFYLTSRDRPPAIRTEGFRTRLVRKSKRQGTATILHGAGAEVAKGFRPPAAERAQRQRLWGSVP